MSNLDRLHKLQDKAQELYTLGLANDFTTRNLDVLIANELILVHWPNTKYERRIEFLSQKYFVGEKMIEKILEKRRTVLSGEEGIK